MNEIITEWTENGCVHRTDTSSRRTYQLNNGKIIIQCIHCGFIYDDLMSKEKVI